MCFNSNKEKNLHIKKLFALNFKQLRFGRLFIFATIFHKSFVNFIFIDQICQKIKVQGLNMLKL